MNSMTGFGSSEIVKDGVKLNVTVKSVNHKNLDIRIKGLAEAPALEQMVKSAIAKGAKRGHFDVFVRTEGESNTDLRSIRRPTLFTNEYCGKRARPGLRKWPGYWSGPASLSREQTRPSILTKRY